MRIVLQGSLSHFGVRDLLAFVARSAQEGTFDAESDDQRVRIALRGGQVIGTESAGTSDAADAVAKLLQWSDGSFTFLDDVVIPESTAADIEALIAEAEMRIAEAKRLADLYPDDSVKFRVVNRPPGEISLTAEEFQLLFQIGTGKSLAQLKSDSGRASADLYPIVKRLQMTGLVEPAGDPDATSRDAGAPKVAPPVFATAMVSPVAAPEPVQLKEPVSSAEKTAASSALAPPPPPFADEQPPTLIEPLAPATATNSGGTTGQSTERPFVATLTADDGVMHPLLEESSTIGRTAVNSIALRDPSVSAKHARIVRGSDGFTIEDLGSRNGTYVNSEKLSEKRLLAEGDLVRLGKIILTFNLASNVQRKQSTEREMMK